MWHCEGRLLFVSLEHGDLVVFEECVYEGEHSMFDSGVYYFINSGQRKTILWSSVIQIGVINIDSPLSSFLWNNHHVRQPFRIFNFLDKPGCQQLVHLRLDDPLPVTVEVSNFLADGSWGRYDIELMWGYRRMNSGHVRVNLGSYGHLFKLFHHCRSDIYGHLIQIFTTMDWTFRGLWFEFYQHHRFSSMAICCNYFTTIDWIFMGLSIVSPS